MQPDAVISSPRWLERLAQLAVRHGVHLSTLNQKDGRDLELIFASAALYFPADRLLDERSANDLLKRFLATAGSMLSTDHVELRRWMCDAGFIRRSDFGTDYRRGALPDWLSAASQELDADRIGTAVVGARQAHDAQREARRQAWLANQIEVTEESAAPTDVD